MVEFVDSLVYAQDCMFPEASSALLFYHSSSSNLQSHRCSQQHVHTLLPSSFHFQKYYCTVHRGVNYLSYSSLVKILSFQKGRFDSADGRRFLKLKPQ